MNNPFELVTASKLTASQAQALWCDDKRLDRVKGAENAFINGHRGTGKSMLFRILQYDCQKLLHPDRDPTFLAVYFPVRDTELLAEEMELFQDDSQKSIISETHLSVLIAKELVKLLQAQASLISDERFLDFMKIIRSSLETAFRFSSSPLPELGALTRVDFLEALRSLLDQERQRIVAYVGLRLYDRRSFDGPLFLFDTMLGPLGEYFLDTLNKRLYILIDDGDDLPESHTIVLNSWIARRRTNVVFKVSTTFEYKTYRTRYPSAIQHPHDFFQYDIATRYLSDSAEDYVALLREICKIRLQQAGINILPEQFFPVDSGQHLRLNEKRESLNNEYSLKYAGRSVRDYVYRHLTSEYMKDLNEKRNLGSYIYAGFDTIALLSSGLIRDFILCAQRMFDNASRSTPNVNSIPPGIQDTVLRRHADEVLEGILDPELKRVSKTIKDDWRRIHRLVQGLGSICRAKMLSDDSERRVFSFAFQDEPGEDLTRLLGMAISEGYFMKGFISRKEGTGRRTLYVLTRRVAPAFNLDVSAYSGYLSMTTERILQLMKEDVRNPESWLEDQTELPFFGVDWKFISPEEAGL